MFSNTVFYLNPAIDYRGRIYYTGVLSPTFNKPIREYLVVSNFQRGLSLSNNTVIADYGLIKLASSDRLNQVIESDVYRSSNLPEHHEVDITSSMITLMIASIKGYKNDPYLKDLVRRIVHKQIDTHSYTLYLTNKALLKLDPYHP